MYGIEHVSIFAKVQNSEHSTFFHGLKRKLLCISHENFPVGVLKYLSSKKLIYLDDASNLLESISINHYKELFPQVVKF